MVWAKRASNEEAHKATPFDLYVEAVVASLNEHLCSAARNVCKCVEFLGIVVDACNKQYVCGTKLVRAALFADAQALA